MEITTFDRLLEDLAERLALPAGPVLSPTQRRALVSLAITGTPLRALSRSASGAGFAPALDELIAELEAALIDAGDFADRAAETAGRAEAELALLYGAYIELRERTGRVDAHALALPVLDALRRQPDAWGRPVFVYGFDELTVAHRELVAELARSAEVTVALTYADRDALAASADLAAELRENIGVDEEVELERDGSYTASPVLDHLDRDLFDAGAGLAEADDGLVLMESAGERGELEAIALEAARLIAAGTPPDEIVVVLRHPQSSGPLLAAVMDEMGVPAALEANVPLAGTGTGGALLALCRAALPSGTAEDLLAHLRLDPAAPASVADTLERRIRRGQAASVSEAIAEWSAPPRHLARLLAAKDPGERLRTLARSAREIAEGAHGGEAPLAEGSGSGATAVPFAPIEVRAGATASALLAELAAVGELPGCAPPDLSEVIAAIEGASVPAWRGPADGRVRISSPHRARGARARYVFCASLQDGEFPASEPANPLLGDERRIELGFPALRRRDSSDEERFLFASTVSRPTERLYLSWRASGEDGAALARSPFVDEVLDLLAPDPETAEAALKRSRGLEQVVPEPADAPTERQLARALAIGREIEPTEEDLPGPVEAEPVLAALRERGGVSANSLEGWLGCPHRWFVDHELKPVRLEDKSDPLWLGSVVHAALERLYREAPGADAIPRPDDVGRWKERLGELLAEEAGEEAAGTDRIAGLARARVQVEAFLDAEAAAETPFRPRPDLLEWRFGIDEAGAPSVELGGLELHGIVDRIDIHSDGRTAIVRDYKTSKRVSGAGSFSDDGTLQIPLYMIAARRLLDLDVVGGLYQPLGAYGDKRPRGLVVRDERTEALDVVWKSKDASDADTLEARLEERLDRARRTAEEMTAGEIGRRPLGGRCPKYCTYQAICRLERGLGDPAENGDAED
jgi:ATP-dependent helicase/DNAse subunit B